MAGHIKALYNKKTFSFYSLIFFCLVFAAIGSYLLLFSHASSLVGDINNDGIVNIFDLSLLLSDYSKSGSFCATNTQYTCDLNHDGSINVFDLSILLTNYSYSVNNTRPIVLTVSPSPGLGQTPGIYTLDPTTKMLELVGSQNSNASDASMSADGKLIVYTSSANNSYQIHIMNSDGSNDHAITNGGTTDLDQNVDPSFSADNQKIAFIRYNGSTNGSTHDVYVMNADGSNQVNLTNGCTGEVHPADDCQYYWTDWSPDNTNVLYVNCCLVAKALTRISLNGTPIGTPTYLIQFAALNGRYSPNGSWIVYSGSNEPSLNINLYITDLTGNQKNELLANVRSPQDSSSWTPSAPNVSLPAPTWSPDGTKIAFLYNNGGDGQTNSGVYIINPNGSGMSLFANFPLPAVVNSIAWK